MKRLPAHVGRRARQLVPSLATQAAAIGLVQPALGDDLRLFTTTLAGGLVFFGTFFG